VEIPALCDDRVLELLCLFSFRFVLLASGLGLGSSDADSMLGLQLLVDMVTGQLGDMGEQSGAATISRVLLAGNLLSQSTQEKDASTKVAKSQFNLTLNISCSCIFICYVILEGLPL